MTSDTGTLSVYNERAADYADMAPDSEQISMLNGFISEMPVKARVLDYGCGPGYAAGAMLSHGLIVDAFDASPKMVELAQQHIGVDVRLRTFDEIDAEDRYHGIWASFSLLHVPKSAFPTYLGAIQRALRPGGLLTLGMKLGEGEKRDSIGRFYAYFSQPELTNHLIDAGLTPAESILGESIGLAGDSAPYIVINARA